MRDLCQKTNIDYGAKLGLATCPKKVKSSVIKRAIRTWIIGTRCPSSSSKWSQRHEWKAAHGFRKFYKSRAEQVLSQ